jgi:hypothetical protein
LRMATAATTVVITQQNRETTRDKNPSGMCIGVGENSIFLPVLI